MDIKVVYYFMVNTVQQILLTVLGFDNNIIQRYTKKIWIDTLFSEHMHEKASEVIVRSCLEKYLTYLREKMGT